VAAPAPSLYLTDATRLEEDFEERERWRAQESAELDRENGTSAATWLLAAPGPSERDQAVAALASMLGGDEEEEEGQAEGTESIH
jgi:alkylhydroperoxidase family enzyme